MNNFEDYLNQLVSNKEISESIKIDILERYNYYSIREIYTFPEIVESYNIHMTTLVRARNSNKFNPLQIRKAKGTWLITKNEIDKLINKKGDLNE